MLKSCYFTLHCLCFIANMHISNNCSSLNDKPVIWSEQEKRQHCWSQPNLGHLSWLPSLFLQSVPSCSNPCFETGRIPIYYKIISRIICLHYFSFSNLILLVQILVLKLVILTKMISRLISWNNVLPRLGDASLFEPNQKNSHWWGDNLYLYLYLYLYLHLYLYLYLYFQIAKTWCISFWAGAVEFSQQPHVASVLLN